MFLPFPQRLGDVDWVLQDPFNHPIGLPLLPLADVLFVFSSQGNLDCLIALRNELCKKKQSGVPLGFPFVVIVIIDRMDTSIL